MLVRAWVCERVLSPPSVLEYPFPWVFGCIHLIVMYSFLTRQHTHSSPQQFPFRQTHQQRGRGREDVHDGPFPLEMIRYQLHPETKIFQLSVTELHHLSYCLSAAFPLCLCGQTRFCLISLPGNIKTLHLK